VTFTEEPLELRMVRQSLEGHSGGWSSWFGL
jgi:hypothetical protein